MNSEAALHEKGEALCLACHFNRSNRKLFRRRFRRHVFPFHIAQTGRFAA